MTFTRIRIMMTAGLLAMAGTAGGVLATAGPAAARPAAAPQVAARQVVLVSCAGHGQVRPATFDNFGCMPSQEFLGDLSWTSWRSTGFGQGSLEVNNCTPNCAQGKFVKYPVLTVLWRARPRPQHAGQRYFTRLTWIYTGKRPTRHAPATETFTLPAS
jgi:hypothetical protein